MQRSWQCGLAPFVTFVARVASDPSSQLSGHPLTPDRRAGQPVTGHTTASNKFAFKPQTYDFTSTLGSSTKYQFAFKSQISNLTSTRLGPCPPCTNPEIVEIKLVFLDLPLCARKKLDKNLVNLGWMNPPWVLVQYASKTLLSSENMNENAEAIFFSGKYLGNKLERIAQFQRKVIW